MKVLIADPIAPEGIEFLHQYAEVVVKTRLNPEELKAEISDCDALVVRSQTKVSAEIIEAGEKLKVIGRAGVGVDNIDVEAATKRGIVVVNAPTSNTVSAAEHTMALMLALARNIHEADRQLKSGKWQREKLVGAELRNKTLGIIGLGHVGSEVAKRALAFEMRLIVYDPFVSPNYAQNLKVELVPLDQLLQEADIISLHTPLTEATRELIGAKEIAKLKPGAFIINCARGGLVNEEAVVKAVKEGKIAGAAFDVFSREPLTDSSLFREGKIIITPHLGASTIEAQSAAARDVTMEVAAVLQGKSSRYAVNAPYISAELIPYIEAASTLGKLAAQLMEGQIESLHIKYSGGLIELDHNSIRAAAISGLLQQAVEEKINLVNVNLIARQRGLKITEETEPTCPNYPNLLSLKVNTPVKATTISVTVRDNETHLVQVDDFFMDVVPSGAYFLLCSHHDRPGLVGAIGNVTGSADVNISAMHLSRLKPRGQALMILALDEPLGEQQRQKVLALPGIYTAKLVQL